MRAGRREHIKLSFHTKCEQKRLISLPFCVTISSISSRDGFMRGIARKQEIGLVTLSIPELRTSS